MIPNKTPTRIQPKPPKSTPKGIIIVPGVKPKDFSEAVKTAIRKQLIAEGGRLMADFKQSYDPPGLGPKVLPSGYQWVKSNEPEICSFCFQGINPEDYLAPCQYCGAPAGRR